MPLAGRALRRQQKIAEWEKRVQELHKKYPRLAEISQLIAQISMETVLLGMGKGKMGMSWEELNKAREALLAEKKGLFNQYNLPSNIDEVWWDCEKCEDRGFWVLGKMHLFVTKRKKEHFKLWTSSRTKGANF